MTVKKRFKNCATCGAVFYERKSDSNAQWENRCYCSMKCNNSSRARFTNIFERLSRYQVVKDGCWAWMGAKDSHGYGVLSSRFGAGHSPEKAHRVSYEKVNGKIKEGLVIRHKCDNPECTNPDHLEVGTQKDNMVDCSRRGRLNEKSLRNLISGAKGFNGAAVEKNKVKTCQE